MVYSVLDSHRRVKSYETSTPDLTSLKLYSPEKKKSFDLLLDYDYTGAGKIFNGTLYKEYGL